MSVSVLLISDTQHNPEKPFLVKWNSQLTCRKIRSENWLPKQSAPAKQKAKSRGDSLSCLWPCPLVTGYSKTANLSAAGTCPRKVFTGKYGPQKLKGLCSQELGSLACEAQGSSPSELKWNLFPGQPERLVPVCFWEKKKKLSLRDETWLSRCH